MSLFQAAPATWQEALQARAREGGEWLRWALETVRRFGEWLANDAEAARQWDDLCVEAGVSCHIGGDDVRFLRGRGRWRA